MARSTRLTNEQRKELEMRSGLDVLREYIPDRDYNDALIEHAAQGTPEERTESRNAMLDRSRAVMTYLRDNGYDFSVSPDKNPGQLRLSINDEKIEVRLLDTDDNAQYAGNRVYDDAVTYRINSAQRGAKYGNKPVDITPRSSVDLVRYALGEDVHRIDKRGASAVLLDEYAGSPDMSSGFRPNTYTTANKDAYSTMYSRGKQFSGIDANGNTYSGFDDAFIYAKTESRYSNNKAFKGENALSEAEAFVEDSRETAIGNFTAAIKLDAVDKLAQSKANNEFEGLPEFSDDNSLVTDTQKAYYDERVKIYSDKDAYPDDNSRNDALYEHDMRFKQIISDTFGNVQARSINPVNVSMYMDATKGSITNENNLLSALKAIQRDGTPYELTGDGFAENGFKDKMAAYDSKPVYDNNGNQIYPKNINPASEDFKKLPEFWQNIGNAVSTGLGTTGVSVNSIDVDQNGIIHYEGERLLGADRKSRKNDKVIGNIGQVFEPDMQETLEDGSPNLKHGLIRTKYNSGNDYYIAPGYTAYVVPPTGDNAGKPYEERTRLRGYEQTIAHEIKHNLRHSVIANNNYDDTTGLNGVYHRIYGDKLPLDFEDQMAQEGKDTAMIKAVIDSSMRRVRYDNCYKEGTSMLAKANAETKQNSLNRGYNLYLDNVGAVMPVMNHETSKGYFDPYVTGTGTNQGIVRYLVEDAKVASDGKIIKGESNRTVLTAHDDFRYADFNPPDRHIMATMNAINQSSTAYGRSENPDGKKINPIGVGTAHMSLGGYTQDDAFVVSKNFADENLIRGKDGEMRPLQIGDKICDHSGNKGVISFIADPNADMDYYKPEMLHAGMSEKEYKQAVKNNDRKEIQSKIIELFKDNPTLDVVGAPYTAPSRFNGGTARELIDSQERAQEANMPTTLKIGGKELDGSIGYCNWIVTDMPVDEKTHLYDDEGGRRSSGQLIWALSEAGATEVIDEIYKYNTDSSVKAREMMLVMGYDMSQTGNLHRGYEPHVTGVDENNKPVYEQRNEFSVKDIYDSSPRDAQGRLHRKSFNETCDRMLAEDGGFMKLPFPITLASGDTTPEKLDENGKGTGEYMLPVLAGKYRSGRETVDNRLLVHEYTSSYKDICNKTADYLSMMEKREQALQSNDTAALEKYSTDKIEAITASVQSTYNAMVDKIGERYFTGKHNIWKDNVMRKQLPNTATAVITPDPTLDIDEIAMSATMADVLGLSKDDPDPHTIVWRDPVLSGGGMRYPRVNIIENRPGYPGYDERNPMTNLVGIAMNPSAASSFEGDFDGDSVGLYTPQSKAAKACAMRTLSYEAQLLNREVGNKGEHNLYVQDGLDVAAGAYADKQNGGNAGERLNMAKQYANTANAQGDRRVDKNSLNHKALEMLNESMHDIHKAAFGEDIISYKNPEEHFKSLIHMTQSGAKGSPSKLVNGYGNYFGCKAEIDENFNLVKFEDVGKPLATPEDREASLAATHAKAVLTGVAGKFSQHAAMMAKNSEDSFSNATAANALTHPVTQSVMQLKHDDAETIRRKIDMIQNVAPELWAGHKIEPCKGDDGKSTWQVVYERNGNRAEPVNTTPAEWKKMFMDFYTDKNGLNVAPPNPEYIETMAKIMTVQEGGKEIIKGFDSKSKAIMPMEKPLDRLAYECNLDTLSYYADKRANLFEGSVNSHIAPKVIRDNIEENLKAKADPTYVPNLKPLAAKDTQVKPDVDTPSVDVVHKMLKTIDAEDIHVVESREASAETAIPETKAEQRETVKSEVKDIPHELKTEKSYSDMTADEKYAVIKSAANKAIDGGKPVYTAAETEFRAMFVKQQAIIREFGKDKEAEKSFAAANPDKVSEYYNYKKAVGECKAERKKAAEAVDPSYSKMSGEQKTKIAESVANKVLNGGKQEYTKAETEFRSLYAEQAETRKAISADKNMAHQFIASHPGYFNEYLLYKAAHEKCVSERAATSKQTPAAAVSATAHKAPPKSVGLAVGASLHNFDSKAAEMAKEAKCTGDLGDN